MGGKRGFGFTYQSVIRNEQLTPEAKCIYAYLCTFAGKDKSCYPGLSLMLKELPMSKDRFYCHMQKLLDAGIVSKKQEKNGTKFGKLIYTINHDAKSFPNNPETEISETEKKEKPQIVSGNRSVSGEQAAAVPLLDSQATNNTSSNNTSLTVSEDEQRYIVILDLLNRAKWKASSKGRLRISTVEPCVKRIMQSGVPYDFILSVAQTLARQGNKNVDAYNFDDMCIEKWKQEKRQKS